VRITIDTREDSYEDALGVLRRAYGRHRLTRKTEEPPAGTEAGKGSPVAKESGRRSASGRARTDAGLRKRTTKATKRPAAKRTSATRVAAAESPVSKTTVGKRASATKAARGSSARTRPGAPRRGPASGVASNTAPPGESEVVRAWAREQGMQVSARGRMPARVISAYLEAHNG
jgi:hypothetical protein